MARGSDETLFSRPRRREAGQKGIQKSLDILSDPQKYRGNRWVSADAYAATDILVDIYAPSISDISRPNYRHKKKGTRPRSSGSMQFRRDENWIGGKGYDDFPKRKAIARLLDDSDAYLAAYQELVAVTNFIEDHDRYLNKDLALLPAQSSFYLPFIERCESLLSFTAEITSSSDYKSEATLWQKRRMKKNREQLLASYKKLASIWESVWSLEVAERA